MKRGVFVNRRGLSDVVTTVLIILLSLVAVAIIGGVVIKNINNSATKFDAQGACQEFNALRPIECSPSGTVTVSRGGDSAGALSKISVIWSDASGNTAVVPVTLNLPDTYATKILSAPITSPPSGFTSIASAKVAASIIGGDGKPIDCDPIDTAVTCLNSPPVMNPLGVYMNPLVYTAPASSILMITQATDSDGTVAKVEFFSNGAKIGEATTPSGGYRYIWTNVPGGSYSITARATDDRGAVSTFTNPNVVSVGYRITLSTSGLIMHEVDDEGYPFANSFDCDGTEVASCTNTFAAGTQKYFVVQQLDGTYNQWSTSCPDIQTMNGKYVCHVILNNHITLNPD